MLNGQSESSDHAPVRPEVSLAELRRFVDATERTLERERVRFARFLHDEVSQTLTVLRLDIEALRKRPGFVDPDAIALLDEMDDAVQATAKTSRQVISELRPGLLDQFGLAAAMEWRAKDLGQRTGVALQVIDETGGRELPPPVATTLFRIFEEAASNVVRHAQARQATVRLRSGPDQVELTVSDDGVGITASAAGGGLGLLAMFERARAAGGATSVRRLPNGGTEVTARIPLSQSTDASGERA